jgi:hypothetical protein
VLLAATAALVVTGYRGGQNVYRYGIGVRGAVSAVPAAINEDAVRPGGRRTAGESSECALSIYCAGACPVKYAST